MTANEIADGLAQMHIEKDVNGLFNKRIQNMLRQQQAEIEALKAGKIRAYDNGVEDGRKPNTNLVKEQDCYGDGNVYRGVRSKDSEVKTIYFNPVKKLTDEEITEIYYPFSLAKYQFNMASPMFDTLGFARAILRKAQEK